MRRFVNGIIAVVIMLMLPASVLAQEPYELLSWTIDGGGSGYDPSQSGYVVLGTVAQPDGGGVVAFGRTGGVEYTLLSGFWPYDFAFQNVYLPVLLAGYDPKPDLVISMEIFPPPSVQYNAGEAVDIFITVTNTGDLPSGPFWVDLYADPTTVPDATTERFRWDAVTDCDPSDLINPECFGLAWAVSGLGPGESITLNSDSGFDVQQSCWFGYLSLGTQTLYAYADSFILPTTIIEGAVVEVNETNNRASITGISIAGGENPRAPVDTSTCPGLFE